MEFKVLDHWNDFPESGIMFKVGFMHGDKFFDELDSNEYVFGKWYHNEKPELLRTSTGLVYHDGFRGFESGSEALNHLLENESQYDRQGGRPIVLPVKYKGFTVAGYDDPRRPILIVRHVKVYTREYFHKVYVRMLKQKGELDK